MTAIPLSRPPIDRPSLGRSQPGPAHAGGALGRPAGLPAADARAATPPAERVGAGDAPATSATALKDLARSHRQAMVWRRAFRGVRAEAHPARAFVQFLLADLAHADDVVQVAGELVANAIVHTRSGRPGGLYVVEVARWRGGVSVAVTDQGGQGEPRLSEEQSAVNGYGMRTVAALATWWGWYGDERGRTVTAVFTRGRAASAR